MEGKDTDAEDGYALDLYFALAYVSGFVKEWKVCSAQVNKKKKKEKDKEEKAKK